MQIGDLVTRNSYQNDILFKIIDIKEEFILKGVYERIKATSKKEDLVLETPRKIEDRFMRNEKRVANVLKYNKRQKGFLTGKILHLDGDDEYLNQCLELYKKTGCFANGIHIKETEMSQKILGYIDLYSPDIIVITGHDSYNKKGLKSINNYVNSSNFIETIKMIRKKYSKDDKFIIAGACQSHFEALIAAGANFATSPKRVNVHLFDPAIVAIKTAYTPFNKVVSIDEIFRFSYIKHEGLGGIESYGKMRLLL